MRCVMRALAVWLLIAAAAPTLARGQAAMDTLVSVEPGTRLDMSNFKGSVTVRTWDRNSVRIVTQGPRHASHIHTMRGSGVLSVQTRHPGKPAAVDYELSVPGGMDLSIHGVETDVRVRDSQGRVQVHTVNGDVDVRGGRGVVELNSVQGSVKLSGAQGKAELSSVNDAVWVSDFRGDLKVSTVNGEVVMRGVDSGSVEATTVNGSVAYQGSLRSDGWYRFNTHNGEIDVVVPTGTGATVEVSTFNGSFQADFPLSFDQTRRGRFNFTLGSGGARIELTAFNGTIRMRSSGGARKGGS